jgi:hypothetical protein
LLRLATREEKPMSRRPFVAALAGGLAVVLAAGVAAAGDGNLIPNSGFDVNLAGWTWSPGADPTWYSCDSDARAASGSLALVNDMGPRMAELIYSPCVAVTPGSRYLLRVDAFEVPGAEAQTIVTKSAVFYPSPDCTGPAEVNGTALRSGAPGRWLSYEHVATAPDTAASAFLRLGIARYEASNPVTVYLDDVFFAPTTVWCAHTDIALCLQRGRFQVRAAWRTNSGAYGDAVPVSLASDSGWFWFFDPTNAELFVKVLDGCALNGHFWLFASGMTNVRVFIGAVDLATGAEKHYENRLDQRFETILDTRAFPCD